jgi:ABC-type branched-subunit amino acid transport system ATPase component/ABC-type branched-subunit amino acid transport system permease subunit
MTRRLPPLGILAAGGLLVLMPQLGLPAFYDSLLYLAFHWIVLATSWNILSGYAGYFSFGHGAFFGAGLYTTATLAGKLDWPFLATLPVAASIAALLGVALGAVVFRVKRVRGELFALLTLAVTFVLATIVLNTPIDGGPGVYLNAVPVPSIGPTQSATFYLLALAAATATMLIAWAIYASKLGLGLFAIHDDEDAAEVMGVPTYGYKLAAFAISCALAGVAGGIHAMFIQYVTAGEVFSITVPLTVVLMSVLGGTRHWAGPAVGATVITALLYFSTAGDHAVLGKAAIGAILVVAILFMPDGILERVMRTLGRRSPTPAPAGERDVTVDTDAAIAPPQLEPALAAGTQRAEVLLRTRNLGKSFKGLRALAGVDVDVRKGEILGLLGPNGSGKSTFINVVSGHYTPTTGEVLLDGRNITRLPAHRIARAGIARTYQIPRPFRHLSVLDNVAVTAMFGNARARTRAEGTAEAMKWLAFTGLESKASARPDDLNLHQRKFLELARALAARPRLVLLDEVLSGLTRTEMNDAVALIRRIRDQGSTIVFVEHVMHAVMALTDRIVVFNQGELLAEGDAEDVMQQPAVMTAYLGRAHA